MSVGGHSLHKKDYLALGTLATAVAAPYLAPEIAAMMGGGAALGVGQVGAGVGASGLAEMAGAGAATPGIGGLLGSASTGNTLQSLARAQQLMALVNPQHGQAPMPQRRQQQEPQYSDAMKLFQQIYGGSV